MKINFEHDIEILVDKYLVLKTVAWIRHITYLS